MTSFARNLRDALDQLRGDGPREREADRALVDLVRCKVVLERRDDVIGGGVERIVLPPSSEIEHWVTVQFVRGDLVRDHFLGSGQGLTDDVPHAFEYALHGLGLRGDVLVHGLEVGLGHRDSSLWFAFSALFKSCRWLRGHLRRPKGAHRQGVELDLHPAGEALVSVVSILWPGEGDF